MTPNNGSRLSFFTSLSGLVKGLAGLVTATAAIAAMFLTSDDPASPAPRIDAQRSAATRTSTAPPTTTTPGTGSEPSKPNQPPAKPVPHIPGKPNPEPKQPSPAAEFRVIEASVSAEPFADVVACPFEIKFAGRIAVEGGPGTVRYRWFGDDGEVGEEQELHFDGSGPQDVDTSRQTGEPGATIEGWQSIEIIEPEVDDPNVAVPYAFQVECEAGDPVEAG